MEELDFKAKLPTYIPDGVIRGVATIYTNNGSSLLNIQYNYDNREGWYHFNSSYYPKPLENLIVEDGNYSWKEIEINGYKGLSAEPDRSTVSRKVMFKTDKNIYYEIVSYSLDFEEMIKILESI